MPIHHRTSPAGAFLFAKLGSCLFAVGLFLATALCLATAAPCWAAQAGEPDNLSDILHVDLITGRLLPTPKADLHVGNIYNYYDANSGRRLWAALGPDGRYGMAMSPGSAQSARLFGFTALNQEQIGVLRKRDPKLAEEVSRDGTEVFLQLSDDNHWRLTRTTVPIIFNADSGVRWEFQFGRYIPVGDGRGYSWQRVGNKFRSQF
jgi:hypothetical protein